MIGQYVYDHGLFICMMSEDYHKFYRIPGLQIEIRTLELQDVKEKC